ncbi:phosphoglycerate dehydrogenase [Ruficoccus amylovorans]|uniref:Phosphoglycerate dehydrogenase n=1 Tax=Ruficoccus amylovorans TaxID=1804625 RepID=A0A842HGK2_9BACT|nr:phosphoglycerate dehydrogenase [Ruficoccus amylovorans]MBC2595148.1 phosphoglycerate dehydrogenase [Ruficoccus amylovorans]
MAKILLTTTSYQDTPGPHHELLNGSGHEVHCERGPLSEQQMLELVGDFDAFLCGDDAITRKVLEKATPKLKIIAKYGIGVDKIDVAAATEMGLPLCFTPGVNHTTVAEHSFALMLALFRSLVDEANYVRAGNWKRLTGHEIMGKTIGIVGLGRIGKEVAIRAKAFGLKIIGNDLYWPEEFAKEYGIERAESFDGVFEKADIISLHTNLTEETRNLISAASIAKMKDGVVILNCARGELVNTADMVAALKSGKVGGYGADVLDEEPPRPDHPLLTAPNCVLTPHIGSRTHESVQRQAMMATQNLLLCLEGKKPLAQVNDVPIPALS